FMAVASACNSEVSSNPVVLQVFPLPKVELLQAPPPVCPGEDASIIMSAENAVSITWEMNTGNGWVPVPSNQTYSGINTETMTINNIPAALQNALFRCVVSGTCGNPVISDEVLLYLNGIPVLLGSPLNAVACSGGAVEFRVIAQGEGIQYQWQQLLPDGNYEDLENEGFFSGTQSPVMQAEAVTELNELVVRCVLTGCGDIIESDTARMLIFQNDPVYIPNAFTPGNDQVNEVFRIYTFGEPELDASIYNRWGEQLYRWTDKEDGWDGRYQNAEVQEGVYVYRIKVTTQCSQKTVQGTLHLIR
ncbi:MAG: gliding motility-associated C-terminal domain-containing protein, partial [Bacteroidetes bacterium]|nr:gliding motility-associated C-terminal domain-containing protein [Bacteroidota bacterium]